MARLAPSSRYGRAKKRTQPTRKLARMTDSPFNPDSLQPVLNRGFITLPPKASAHPKAPDEENFHQFNNFPNEIKCAIWEATAISRTIHVANVYRWQLDYQAKPDRKESPVVMSVCQQSRECGKRIYQFLFDESFTNDGIWFSWRLDTLWLEDSNTLGEFFRHHFNTMRALGVAAPPLEEDLSEVFQKLQHVAYGQTSNMPGGNNIDQWVLAAFAEFRALKTVRLANLITSPKSRGQIGTDAPTPMALFGSRLLTNWAASGAYTAMTMPTITWVRDIDKEVKDLENVTRGWTRDAIDRDPGKYARELYAYMHPNDSDEDDEDDDDVDDDDED